MMPVPSRGATAMIAVGTQGQGATAIIAGGMQSKGAPAIVAGGTQRMTALARITSKQLSATADKAAGSQSKVTLSAILWKDVANKGSH